MKRLLADRATEVSTSDCRRTYAVGDIHGRFDLFRQLILLIERDHAGRPPVPTQIVLLGDIVDRGPDSARIVRGCMSLTQSDGSFIVLKGNHEEMMVEALRGNLSAYSAWLSFGGRETLLSFGVDVAIIDKPATLSRLRAAAKTVGEDTLDWLAKLPLRHRQGKYLFVHAGVRPGISVNRQHAEDLLWIKDEFLNSDHWHGAIIVHGHTIEEDGPVIRANRIGIDTGAYRTDCLTALGIENGATWTLQTRPNEIGSSGSDGALLTRRQRAGFISAANRN